MKFLNLEVLSSILYFYIPTSWEDFSDNEKIKNICTKKNFCGNITDHVCTYLHFLECTFKDCHFKDVEFEEISFVRCHFINCTFENCSIKKTSFITCYYLDCKFLNSSFFTTFIKESSSTDILNLSSCSYRYLIVDAHSIETASFIFSKKYYDDKNLLAIETKKRQLLSYNEFIKLLSS